MFRRRPEVDPLDEDHMPLVAIWFQMRTVFAELLVPLLAGLKTLWLLLFAPATFFEAFFYKTRRLSSLHSPFGFLWRSLTNAPQTPLGPAQFLLFGIFTAALAGFGFDNSNRLSGLLGELNVTEFALMQISQRNATLAQMIQSVQDFFASPVVMTARTFFDQELIAAVVELVLTLLVMVLFAYLFYLLTGRLVSPTRSYSFWLYMIGLQFFTTAVTFLVFSLVGLFFPTLPQIPDILFWLVETGWLVFWHYLFPAFILPRIFRPLTGKRVIFASLLSHAILSGLGWFITTGVITFIALTGLMMG